MIMCLLDVLSGTAAEMPGLLTGCGSLIVDTSSLDMVYPAIPAAAPCDPAPVADKPCGDSWLSKEYESQTDWYDFAQGTEKVHPSPCVACIEASQQVGNANNGPAVEQATDTDGTVLAGSYYCTQGATGLSVHIDTWPSVARFEFFQMGKSSHSCSGEFALSGVWTPSTRALTFTPGAWTSNRNPCNYQTVGLSGHLSANGKDFNGDVTGLGACTQFSTSQAP